MVGNGAWSVLGFRIGEDDNPIRTTWFPTAARHPQPDAEVGRYMIVLAKTMGIYKALLDVDYASIR